MAMLTTFQSTTGGVNWSDTFATLQMTGIFNSTLFVLHLFFFIFALSNVVTSIFVDKALKLAKPDLDWMMFEKQRSEAIATKELRLLAQELDTTKKGRISRKELMTMAEDSRVRHLFQLYDIDIADVDLFYQMMAEIVGSSELDIEIFIAACMKMKGNASSADVQMLIYQTKLVQSSLDSLGRDIGFLNDA